MPIHFLCPSLSAAAPGQIRRQRLILFSANREVVGANTKQLAVLTYLFSPAINVHVHIVTCRVGESVIINIKVSMALGLGNAWAMLGLRGAWNQRGGIIMQGCGEMFGVGGAKHQSK